MMHAVYGKDGRHARACCIHVTEYVLDYVTTVYGSTVDIESIPYIIILEHDVSRGFPLIAHANPANVMLNACIACFKNCIYVTRKKKILRKKLEMGKKKRVECHVTCNVDLINWFKV